jgi:cytochrome P450
MIQPPYEYLPFGGGPHMCIGATFAMMELKLVLPLIVQRYRLELAPRARIERGGLVLSTIVSGLPMRIHPQDRRFDKSEVRGNIRDLVDLT